GISVHVLALAVVYDHVLGELLGDLAVHAGIVGGEACIRGDVLLERLLDAVEHGTSDVERAHLPTTLDQGENLLLVARAGALLHAGLATDVGLIGLDDTANVLAHRDRAAALSHWAGLAEIRHRKPYTVGQEP